MFGKVKLPKQYEELKWNPPEEMNIPKGAKNYGICTSGAKGNFIEFKLDENWTPMPFDDDQSIIESYRNELNDNQGIIEVKHGTMESGGRYVYSIIKQTAEDEGTGIPFGMEYSLGINFEIDGKIHYINGYFTEEGITGMRESSGFMILEKAKEEGLAKDIELFCDPYDPKYKKGLLRHFSEGEQFDEKFPDHPLSLARSLVKFIIENN